MKTAKFGPNPEIRLRFYLSIRKNPLDVQKKQKFSRSES